MIAVDTNLLVYAHRVESPFFARAQSLIKRLAEAPGAWAIPWPCLHEFLSTVTHPRIFKPPTPLEIAIAQIDAWCSSSSLVLLSESEAHWETLRPLILRAAITGPMVHDAKIAALCLQQGVQTLWTADRDFSRFPQLRCRNPLMEAA